MHIVVPHLGRLQTSCLKRLKTFRGEIERCPRPLTKEGDWLVATIAIETLNLWASFARAYYLSCCLRTKRVAGGKVGIAAAGINGAGQAIHFAIQQLKPWLHAGPPWHRRDEPVWHDPQTLLKLSAAIGASNLAQIQAAFGYRTRVFVDLPVFRNFFAHRNDESAGRASTRARYYRLSSQLRPAEILCMAAPGRPQRLMADWLDDMGIVMELLCQ
jgi:hypothetical protein